MCQRVREDIKPLQLYSTQVKEACQISHYNLLVNTADVNVIMHEVLSVQLHFVNNINISRTFQRLHYIIMLYNCYSKSCYSHESYHSCYPTTFPYKDRFKT